MNKNKLFASVIGLLVFVAGLSAKDYQVAMFGIKSDGVTLNTRSIQRAVDYISEQGGGRLIFYVGRYLTGSIELKSNVTIRIEEGAVLVAVPSVYDFKGVGGCNAIIYADKQKNIGIGGKGVIDGRSIAVRASVEEQYAKRPYRRKCIRLCASLDLYEKLRGCENRTGHLARCSEHC